MKTNILTPDSDPMGHAIADYFNTGRSEKLRVLSPEFDEDEIPLDHLFRSRRDMPMLEQLALSAAQGRVLDVGAGSGCHALALQQMNKRVTAIDISPLSVEVMRSRGVKHAELQDFFALEGNCTFQTILMLMNGIGIVGRVARLPLFFAQIDRLLEPHGCVLADSTDLRYLFENEDGSLDIDLAAGYYGEMDFRMKYGRITGPAFPWLYIDFDTLAYHAARQGFKATLMEKGLHYDYLARIERANEV